MEVRRWETRLTTIANMKRYQLNKIKRRHFYDINEIVGDLGIGRKTVQRWMKEGLKPILPNKKPLLFDGQVLYDFLKGRRIDRKTPLKDDELYCFSCRKGVRTRDGTDRIEKTGKRIGRHNLEQYRKTGLCELCDGKISRLLKTPPERTNGFSIT